MNGAECHLKWHLVCLKVYRVLSQFMLQWKDVQYIQYSISKLALRCQETVRSTVPHRN